MDIQFNELDIISFHVGGYGDYSHINIIGMLYPQKTVYVAFEARDSGDDEVVKQEYLDRGIRSVLVQKCIADKKGINPFNINVSPASSSMYKASSEAMTEHMPDQESLPMWGSHSTTERTIQVETTTIDDVVQEYRLPAPDILSIDAQGAEFGIMKGGVNCIANSVMAVVTEVEFYPIYQNQPLFHQQFELLFQKGFRLADVLAMQYWHPVARVGQGLLTVGEALFMRYGQDYLESLNMVQLIKYAAIALAFNRLSLAVHAMNIAIQRFGSQVIEILNMNQEFSELLRLQHYILKNMEQYQKNAFYFENDETLRDRYGVYQNLTNRSLQPMYLQKASH
ncbi:MAG: FkbM family methyltransferase [Desulfobacteraceae bacterium]|nr:FkbM family methyltransferase [Desulfobacteraceae bacterium]